MIQNCRMTETMPGKLPKALRDRIIRMAEEGYNNKEIQDELDVTPPTVRKYAGPARARGTVKSRQVLQAEVDELKIRLEFLETTLGDFISCLRSNKKCHFGHRRLIDIPCSHGDDCSDCGAGMWLIPEDL